MAKDNIDKKTADEELSIKMKPLINTIKGKYIGELVKAGNSSVTIKDIEVEVRYPWNRMFEIEVLPEIILQQGS
jgi:phosphoribosyl-dephospho-CoA transferase